jgi:four helix bundle protein
MPDYRNYEAFKRAHQLALAVYTSTSSFPADERYGLISQLRRAAVSIPSNLAEGSGRGSDKDFARFVRISIGSANELEYGLRLSHDLGFLDPAEHEDLAKLTADTRKTLVGLKRILTG